MNLHRREVLGLLAGAMATAAGKRPANRNIQWALSLGLWNHFKPVPFTDILDVMKDTGFIGIRLTGFPGVLKTYNLTTSQMEKEVSKRDLHVCTISFGGPTQDPEQHAKVLEDARKAMDFLKIFGAKHLVVFPPARLRQGVDTSGPFRAMCQGFNKIGELANEMGFRAGLHNHLDQMVETPDEVNKCMAMTNPKLFWFSPDTAHLHLGGSNVLEMFQKYKNRIMFMDYKDAKWTTPAGDVTLGNGRVLGKNSKEAKFFSSIYDLGDGEIDFPGCHRVLKDVNYKGWICVDLDTARQGPRASYEHCGDYIVNRLEPIYL